MSGTGRTLVWKVVPLLVSISVQLHSLPVTSPVDTLAYLERFGYVERAGEMAKGKLKEALEKFQYYAAIPRTGVMDQSTMRAMSLSRCGNPDIRNKPSRRKRYVLDSKWEKRFLSYRVLNYPKEGLGPDQVEQEVKKAFQFWTNATNIHVKRTNAPPSVPTDLEISFVSGKHNDGVDFDEVVGEGEGRVIAHAWKPFNHFPLRGDIHLNNEMRWRSGTGEGEEGFHFLRTVVHEAGHSLGLEHSPHPDAIMFFAVPGHNPPLQLSKDDLAGIKELYGEKKTEGSGRGGTGQRPAIVPSGTPDDNIPWECYRVQDESPKDLKAIQSCYQQFYRDVYLRINQG